MQKRTDNPAEDILVSVVLVCYNQEKYIAQALDSVLMQKTDFPFEIIVGDDASGDTTPDIVMQRCEQYPDRIRFIRRETNIGATRNAYELMLLCRGRYIAYLEGDDYWTDEYKLQKQADFLIGHPDYLGCTSRFHVVDSEGRELNGSQLEWVRQKKRFSYSDFDG
ncbi:MAG: glycosyltransferase family 2 protein, partial [Oscillospiraceae bacterium]